MLSKKRYDDFLIIFLILSLSFTAELGMVIDSSFRREVVRRETDVQLGDSEIKWRFIFNDKGEGVDE